MGGRTGGQDMGSFLQFAFFFFLKTLTFNHIHKTKKSFSV